MSSTKASSPAPVNSRAKIDVVSSLRMTGEILTVTLWPMMWASSSCQSVPPALAPPPADADPPAAVGESDDAESPPFDNQGSPSHPAGIGSPAPVRADRATKDR